MAKMIDISNRRFHSWQVGEERIVRKRATYWKCVCDCGRVAFVASSHLRKGFSKSCGCTRRRYYSDGERKLRRAWYYMHYSGHPVAEEWKDFSVFLRDVGRKPSPSHRLGRKDKALGFSPSNCKWMMPSELMRGIKSSRPIFFRGTTKNLTEWAEGVGISKQALHQRLASPLWPLEEALTMPPTRRRGKSRPLP